MIQIVANVGLAGSGKSVLCSAVVNHLVGKYTDANAAIAYFYFTFNKNITLTVDEVLASVFRQLLVGFKEVHETMPGFIENLRHDLLRNHRPGRQQFENMLKEFVNSFDSVFIILDGLDEYSETRRERLNLLGLLESLVSSLPNTHIFCTSRREVSIDNLIIRLLEGKKTLLKEIDLADSRFGEIVSESLDMVIDEGIKYLSHGPFSASTEDTIKTTLQRRGDGM